MLLTLEKTAAGGLASPVIKSRAMPPSTVRQTARASGRRSRTRQGSRSDERRRKIFKSLHDCIISKGYMKTSLADIAEGAGMSASHLLYYFKGKEAVLEQYFETVSERFLERMDSFSNEPATEQIRLLADFWFHSETGTKLEIGFMLECFGAAVHDEVLKITKAEFDLSCKDYLSRIFVDAPGTFMATPKDAAEIAYAMMIGLRSAVYFDDDIDLDEAHRLFQDTLLRMCGVEGT